MVGRASGAGGAIPCKFGGKRGPGFCFLSKSRIATLPQKSGRRVSDGRHKTRAAAGLAGGPGQVGGGFGQL